MQTKLTPWQEGKRALGDAWYITRVFIGELFLYFAIITMPEGPERAQMEKHVFEYCLWVKE